MNIVQLAALLASFALGVVFALVAAWPRRGLLDQPEGPSEPQISWPSMLSLEARLGIAVELAASRDSGAAAILERARDEERDPRMRAVIDRALGPVIGEPR